MAEYRYDALGRRIAKIVNGVSTRFVYDNEDIVATYRVSVRENARQRIG